MNNNMWQKYKLSEIGTIVGGATPSTKNDAYYGGDIPWLTPKDLSSFNERYIEKGERCITQEGLRSCSAKILPADSVLFSSRAPIGYVAIAKNDVATNQGFKSIVPNENTNSLFLYYLLVFNKEKIEAMGSGTTFKEVSGATMKNIEVCLPSLSEQERIAAILGSLDDKIELNNKINANLEAQAQALYKQWFVDFEFPDTDGNPYKSAGGKSIDSLLGAIPEGWRIGKFTDIVSILGGGTPKTTIDSYWGGEIPFFTPKDVGDACYVFDTEKYITTEGLNNCNSRLYPKNTIFITARGTVGKIALAGCNMAMNQSCYALVGKEGYNQLYVYNLTQQTISALKGKANGAVFDAITTRDFESENIIIPTLAVVADYNSVVESIYESIHLNVQENQRLVQLRDSLLPKLMNNEIKQ
ncbi:MAG: restriction endonuclease subunit S [Rikenellaceae bacterium]